MPELSRKEEARRAAAVTRRSGNVHALPPRPARTASDAASTPAYAELHCLTHFSFQRGASSPEDLVRRAWALGYTALAITDECSVAGVVRAWSALRVCAQVAEPGDAWDEALLAARAARRATGVSEPLKLLYGSEFRFAEGTLVALARDLASWGDLCQFITACRRGDANKGEYRLPPLDEVLATLAKCERLWAPSRSHLNAIDFIADRAASAGTGNPSYERLGLLLELHGEADDALWQARLMALSGQIGWPLAAAGDVQMHVRAKKRLHDVMTAIRLGKSVSDCGFALQANGERHLRPLQTLSRRYPPETLACTLIIASRCGFDLHEIRAHYQYPLENLGQGETPSQTLARKTWAGARRRYPQGVPANVQQQVAHELALIAELGYDMFFLTVESIVAFARSKNILCQGRGSSANSAVCFCLGITAIDPARGHLLFERFMSRERAEPPDIDVDFEHERREEVIQHIYTTYGRDRAALAATVISYRSRSALRDAGKALGIDERLIELFARDHHWFDAIADDARLQEALMRTGAQERAERLGLWIELAGQLHGAPRHLSQHVGGFVLTQGPLARLVPIENAAMADRSVIQWDKDDLEAMGMLKVDVLALGMLTAIRRSLDFINDWRSTALQMHQAVPRDDDAVFDMLCAADTVGVFQVESRAQMSMLPRLRPRCYDDLVVQVAIVRPGPISGGMVHPYLNARKRQRQGLPIEYERSSKEAPDAEPRTAKALKRTLGIPIFQEQVMELSMLAAGFSAGQADQLRRAMAAWKRKGGLEPFQERLINGMHEQGYSNGFAKRIFEQIKGFGDYGFPESHAASFALLVQVSAWIKHHEPACFLAAMLDSLPMGFYSAWQLVQDAQRHGVEVRAVDVMHSHWHSSLEVRQPRADDASAICLQGRAAQPAVRLGFSNVKGLSSMDVDRLMAARHERPFASVEDLALRAQLDTRAMERLASAGALSALAGHRRQQLWQAIPPVGAALLTQLPVRETPLALAPASEAEEITIDCANLGLTLRRHPLAVLRQRLARRAILSSGQLRHAATNSRVRAAGLVTVRQRPQTAKGTIFVSLEDEDGTVNVIVWPKIFERWRTALLQSRLLMVEGLWQRDADSGHVQHLIARRLQDLTPLLGDLAESTRSRDFH